MAFRPGLDTKIAVNLLKPVDLNPFRSIGISLNSMMQLVYLRYYYTPKEEPNFSRHVEYENGLFLYHSKFLEIELVSYYFSKKVYKLLEHQLHHQIR